MDDSEFVQMTDTVGDLIEDVGKVTSSSDGKVSEVVGLLHDIS